jgi:membrane-associated protein
MLVYMNMSFLDPKEIVQSGGVLLVAAIVFAESGLLIGFFLPGDSLLFSAGFFAAQGQLPIASLLAALVVAAILGDNVGYTIGRRLGKNLYKKKDSLLFRREHLEKATKFYEKHGGKTVTFARFVPVIRTFAPVIAGATKMDRKKFMSYNILGGLLWTFSVTLSGYYLGSKFTNIEKYMAPMVLFAMAITFLPAIYHLLKDKFLRKKIVEIAEEVEEVILLEK